MKIKKIKMTLSYQSLPKINEKRETGETVSNFKASYNMYKVSVVLCHSMA